MREVSICVILVLMIIGAVSTPRTSPTKKEDYKVSRADLLEAMHRQRQVDDAARNILK